MADNDALVSQFIDVTGVQRERAEFYLQAANFQLDVALSSFYEDGPEPSLLDAQPTLKRNSDSSDDDNDEPVKPKENVRSTGFGNIATMSSVRNEQKEGDDEEKGQAFYAGGSEHSGQQILGPPRKRNPIKDIVSEVFKQAQSGNLEQFDASQESSSSTGAGSRSRGFGGTGYRLGQTEEDSEVVASASGRKKQQQQEEDTVTVRVYRQGFTVDDGDIRSYEDPRNREFFESITRNEIPAELRKQGKSMVHVNVEDHLSEDYVKKAPKFKAFTGSGNTLGSPTPQTTVDLPTTTTSSSGNPAASDTENEAKAASDLNVNQNEATTMISIRLADGSRLSTRFNLTHTVQDIRQYIVTARPVYSGQSFMLLTTFPSKELVNQTDTIQQAGLNNAAILQRIK